jgi:hypothetical protein
MWMYIWHSYLSKYIQFLRTNEFKCMHAMYVCMYVCMYVYGNKFMYVCVCRSMARRLMKVLEDFSMQYDMTVRNSEQSVVQFSYGDDELNPHGLHTYIHTYIHTHTHTYIHTYTPTFSLVVLFQSHIHTFLLLYVCMYVCMYKCMHAYFSIIIIYSPLIICFNISQVSGQGKPAVATVLDNKKKPE